MVDPDPGGAAANAGRPEEVPQGKAQTQEVIIHVDPVGIFRQEGFDEGIIGIAGDVLDNPLKSGVTPALIGIVLIPILSGLLSFLLSKVSMAGSQTQGSAAASNKTMMLMMPLMSVYIAFIMPAALGVY